MVWRMILCHVYTSSLRMPINFGAVFKIWSTWSETAPGAETVKVLAQEQNNSSFRVLGLELSTF